MAFRSHVESTFRLRHIPRSTPLSKASSVNSYRDLVAWQRAFALADLCLDVADQVSRRHPSLAEQIRRSSVSVASNIAEGNGRLSLGDYLRFLRIAHGSLRELETQLLLAQTRQRYAQPKLTAALDTVAEVGRLLGGLMRSLMQLRERRAQAKKGGGSSSPPPPPRA